MSTPMHDKIAKLFALSNDAGATENEAAQALRLATALMLKHNISEDEIRKNDAPKVCRGIEMEIEKKWHEVVSWAVQDLYSVKSLWLNDTFVFVGRADNIDAAQQTYVMIVDQIEMLYKQSLPKGMSKQDRAQYRRDFKQACAVRVQYRAREIVNSLMRDEQTAQAATGCTALVIINKRKELEQEIDDFFEEISIKKTKSRGVSVKSSQGAADGLRQGNNVQLNRRVG